MSSASFGHETYEIPPTRPKADSPRRLLIAYYPKEDNPRPYADIWRYDRDLQNVMSWGNYDIARQTQVAFVTPGYSQGAIRTANMLPVWSAWADGAFGSRHNVNLKWWFNASGRSDWYCTGSSLASFYLDVQLFTEEFFPTEGLVYSAWRDLFATLLLWGLSSLTWSHTEGLGDDVPVPDFLASGNLLYIRPPINNPIREVYFATHNGLGFNVRAFRLGAGPLSVA